MRTALLGLGHHLPPAVEAGGVKRPIAATGGTSDLALPAAEAALARAGATVGDVDFIVFATMTPDVTFPGAACYFQSKLACGTIASLDIRAQCAGFLFGLSVADQFIRLGTHRRVLLAAAEVMSPGLDYSERGARVAALFGDGAAAAVLGPGEGDAGLRSIVIHADGRHYDRFWCEYPASRQHPTRMTLENFRQGRHFPELDCDSVRRFGVATLPAVIDEALAAAGAARDEVDLFVLGHAFPDVVDEVAAQMKIANDKVSNPSREHGHLVAASLPVALSRAAADGRVGPGATVCLAACGAGFTWGAAVVQL